MLCACQQSPSSSAQQTQNAAATPSGQSPPPAAPTPTASPSQSGSTANPFGALLGRGKGPSRPLPAGLVIGGDCPDPGPDADKEIAAQRTARVPLEEGLTLTDLWSRTSQEQFECLTQVTKVDRMGIEITLGCTAPDAPQLVKRRICRADLRDAVLLHTGAGGVVIESAEGVLPETIVGATQFSLSLKQFAELKRTGTTKQHYVQRNTLETLEGEAEGLLHNDGTGTLSLLVNDRLVDVPVVRASADVDFWFQGRSMKARIAAAILDDDRFPMLIDYQLTTDDMPNGLFRLNFAKITHPDGGDMERALADDEPVDVYGIYFDFASDRIRPESEPVLNEIAGVLARNPTWKMSIAGHTDNVGGTASNLALSQRRSAAVRTALINRYHVAADRLTTTGYGESSPKDTNETLKGRARNRRVELRRQK